MYWNRCNVLEEENNLHGRRLKGKEGDGSAEMSPHTSHSTSAKQFQIYITMLL